MRVLLAALVFFGAVGGAEAEPSGLTVMSYNIRCGYCEAPDDINHWSRRLPLVAGLIARQQPDVVGLQEAELFQVRDLVEHLPEYAWYGVGRDDGADKGESNAVLYRKDRLSPESQCTLWLSPTPEIAGKGWDAAYNRTVTVMRFRDRMGGGTFYLFNTHFDHQGPQARMHSSRMLAALAGSETGALPLIVTGDLNFAPDHAGYRILTGTLTDAHSGANAAIDTYNGFGKTEPASGKIDYIFVNGGYTVRSSSILTDRPDGSYPSDHYPVTAVIVPTAVAEP